MTATRTWECREVLQHISAYLDGDLDKTACDQIERHCQQCESCAAVVEGLQATIGLCRQAASAELPASVRERAKAAVQQLLDESSGKRS